MLFEHDLLKDVYEAGIKVVKDNEAAEINAKRPTNFLNNVGDGVVSEIRLNREYLLSDSTAWELNTYNAFYPFATFNDLYETAVEGEATEGQTSIKKDAKVGTPGVRSIFNKSGAVIIGTSTGHTENVVTGRASEWRISNNVPLMDNRLTRAAIRDTSKCSVKDLVEASQKGLLGKATYNYSDFMYCKHLGKIPNNYLITLRRFPTPVDDYISTIGVGEKTRNNKDIKSQNPQSVGCMVTWLGTPGNEMANILKYSYKMPFKSQKAQMQDAGIDADANQTPLNSIASIFDEKYRAQYQAGQASSAANVMLGKFFKVGNAPYPAAQWNSFRDSTKVYGPVDTVKDVYTRSEEGLEFSYKMTLTFDYELRSYNGINPRQAMLDLLANILAVTYNTGTFWGGGYRGGGAHQNNIFANLNIFKKWNGFTGFLEMFSKDCQNIGNEWAKKVDQNGGLLETIKTIANQLGGMIVAGFMNQMGRPQKVLANSLLSPAPAGFWHVTIGNPYHPIISIGNMIITNCTVEHYGPLGLDDFPTGLKVVVELDRGKSRDIRDIEKLYMHGNDRIYTSMGPKVFKMYENAKRYNNAPANEEEYKLDFGQNSELTSRMEEFGVGKDLKAKQDIIQKAFGETDAYSIFIAASEQECGAFKRSVGGTTKTTENQTQ